ncbi:MAG: protein-L-isoaspartate(D-aspartate) O-methyltransferase [Deltaproteobacteria bacterium]|nr:protein-L-isoaspartate(D-aspartate) O-methyltransferase [Deltaproteobacteria bacterium]
MVATQLANRGVVAPAVLSVMRAVPRHLFVPPDLWSEAYADRPLPIGYDQTISQPYVVAIMTELLQLRPSDRVLEIGTGSGYQAAVLSRLVAQVYSMEIVAPLAERAASTLSLLGCANVTVRAGDGFEGWPEAAPFDRIILTAAPTQVPEPLLQQLKPGGRLVAPVGAGSQQLMVYEKDHAGGITRHPVLAVSFVPMTGRTQEPA